MSTSIDPSSVDALLGLDGTPSAPDAATSDSPEHDALVREFMEILERQRPPPNHSEGSLTLEALLRVHGEARKTLNAAEQAKDPDWEKRLRLSRTFMDWEVEAFVRIFLKMHQDPAAQAALAGVLNFTILKNRCAGW